MRYSINWSADKTTLQLVLEAQNDKEDEVLRDLYLNGKILALGETDRGRAELVLATSPPDHRFRGMNVIAKQGAPRGPGRRREEDEEEPKIGPGWWPDGWEPKPPLLGTKKCRCPSCQYTVVVEAGTRCLFTDCPLCGHRMVEE